MKRLLFSVTKDNCRWDYFRCPGNGGQKVNKTNSGVRCVHKLSGAVGTSTDTRDQHKNRKTAFERMANSSEFKKWHRIETARRNGELDNIDSIVEKQMKSIKIEVVENGKWVEENQ